MHTGGVLDNFCIIDNGPYTYAVSVRKENFGIVSVVGRYSLLYYDAIRSIDQRDDLSFICCSGCPRGLSFREGLGYISKFIPGAFVGAHSIRVLESHRDPFSFFEQTLAMMKGI